MKVLVACLALAGCASLNPMKVADPTTITVSEAFSSVADGLGAFQSRLKATDGLHLGVIVCKIIVKFNISATADLGGNVGSAITTPTKVQAKISSQVDNSATGNRGNTVEIDLNSVDTSVCPAQKGIMNGQGTSYGSVEALAARSN